MVFKKGVKQNLIALVERQTRFTMAIKNDNKMASNTAIAIIKALTPIKHAIKSITFAQGVEFNRYSWIQSCLNAKIYFCDPGSPYQKGSIENRNGVIRTLYKRNYNIADLKQSELNTQIQLINDRPGVLAFYHRRHYSTKRLVNHCISGDVADSLFVCKQTGYFGNLKGSRVYLSL